MRPLGFTANILSCATTAVLMLLSSYVDSFALTNCLPCTNDTISKHKNKQSMRCVIFPSNISLSTQGTPINMTLWWGCSLCETMRNVFGYLVRLWLMGIILSWLQWGAVMCSLLQTDDAIWRHIYGSALTALIRHLIDLQLITGNMYHFILLIAVSLKLHLHHW